MTTLPYDVSLLTKDIRLTGLERIPKANYFALGVARSKILDWEELPVRSISFVQRVTLCDSEFNTLSMLPYNEGDPAKYNFRRPFRP